MISEMFYRVNSYWILKACDIKRSVFMGARILCHYELITIKLKPIVFSDLYEVLLQICTLTRK